MNPHSKGIADRHVEQQEFLFWRAEPDRPDKAIQFAGAMQATDAVSFVPSAGTRLANSRGGHR